MLAGLQFTIVGRGRGELGKDQERVMQTHSPLQFHTEIQSVISIISFISLDGQDVKDLDMSDRSTRQQQVKRREKQKRH